jgi:hypothetical protein
MATATAEATPADLLGLLAEGEKPLADLVGLVPDKVMAACWARGEIEIGRLKSAVSGRPGVAISNPTLIIEDGVEWSGPKSPRHKPWAGAIADLKVVPECSIYKKYVPGENDSWKTVPINRADAAALLAPVVRLTDKGQANVV